MNKNVNDKYSWNLGQVFACTSFEKEKSKIEGIVKIIINLKGKIAYDINNFKKYLKASEDLNSIIGKCSYFLFNQSSSDLSNLNYQKQLQEFSIYLEPFNVDLSFVDNELLDNIDKLLKYIESDNLLKDYKFTFDHLKSSKNHKLSDIEEKLLAKISPFLGKEEEIFSKLTGADFLFNDVKDSSGKKHKLFQGNAHNLLTHKDKVLRKNTYLEFWNVYYEHKHTLALNYFNNIKSTSTFSKLYKYPSSLEMSLFSDNISTEFYLNVLNNVNKNNYLVTKWKKILLKVFNVKNPKPWDISGPLFPECEKKYQKEGAIKIIYNALKNLGNDYQDKLKYIFENNLIDWMPNQYKRSGAYSYCVWDSMPFILMNWNNKYVDVSTLIHELGHSIHSLYSNQNQSYVNHQYPIFIAEVASIVNEILLVFYLLENEKNNNVKKFILENAIKEIFAIIFRQSQFAEFEYICHKEVDSGKVLCLDDFLKIANKVKQNYYPKLKQEKYFDKYLDLWGLYVPHFYSDFYVYKYVTGCLAACVFASKIIDNDKPAIEKYINLLKSGGKDYPLKLLKQAGVDLENPNDINHAFKLVDDLLGKLENLL